MPTAPWSTAPRRRRSSLAALAVLALAAPAAIPAQTVEGAVLQPTQRRPIATIAVALLRATGDSSEDARAVVDTTTTDAEGRFQLVAPGAGSFRVRIGTSASGYVYGPADSLAGDTTIARAYMATVIRDGAAADSAASFALVPPCSAAPAADEHTGCVVLAFDVDLEGHPRMGSVRVLRADHASIVDVARRHLPDMLFGPVTDVGGHRTRPQRIEMPFWSRPADARRAPKGGDGRS